MKKILITGAATGFGRETAIALAKRGHQVIAATYDESQAESLAEYSTSQNVELTIMKLDITNPDDVEQVKAFDLDVLINNAGIGEGGALVEVPLERIRNNLETNVIGTIAMIQAAAPKMMAKKSGTIIIVTSLVGRIPLPFLSPYSMTKFALESAGAGLAEELSPFGVNVSMIEPGPYGTGFNEANMEKKFSWMKPDSLYKDHKEYIAQVEQKSVLNMQSDNIQPVIDAMVKAAEHDKPKLRYAVPKWMGLAVNVMRGFGK
ncbi:SDR family NAD(P)-dependent oxidoreductase [Thalassotalea euphylliae]|uniref:SDR family NAD(P)-dependent oxidoreductase n=1 Tax=Thalassotalea euphylliae TaxID=1655234 RepID=A0A3E0TU19_9GAMM|nr:SDR family NAD(P)-dependent oxidoreductase [Thalassotalea euphylliae]REL28181.1 SDR family NAD(P)-dependent oxidoreductase [Thalassotalea euphylliae]